MRAAQLVRYSLQALNILFVGMVPSEVRILHWALFGLEQSYAEFIAAMRNPKRIILQWWLSVHILDNRLLQIAVCLCGHQGYYIEIFCHTILLKMRIHGKFKFIFRAWPARTTS